MGNVFKVLGDFAKKGFFVVTALAIAGLNLLMLLDVFQGNILFVILGMVFFSIATWVYLVTAFGAKDDDSRSGLQIGIAWGGLILSLVGELSMAGFEILRMQSFIETPDWISTVTIIVIEVAIVVHLLLGIAYFAASADYNETLSRVFENSRRRATEERTREARAAAEIKMSETATQRGIELTRSMLEAAMPIVAERKAKEMALDISRAFGLDADPELQAAFEQAIREYREGFSTRALQAGQVIDAPVKDVNPTRRQSTK